MQGSVCVLQVIDKHRLDDVSRAHLFQEVRCMKLVQHPNVVRLYEVIDTQTKLYLVLELGDGGDLYDYIMKHERGLNEQEASYYFSQVLHCDYNFFLLFQGVFFSSTVDVCIKLTSLFKVL